MCRCFNTSTMLRHWLTFLLLLICVQAYQEGSTCEGSCPWEKNGEVSTCSGSETGLCTDAGASASPGGYDAQEKLEFVRQNKNAYGYEGRIDELYSREVGSRMGANEHYLDYTGSAVYCQSQLDAAFKELKTNMFGNPHSQNPSSSLTQKLVEEARDMVLRFFNADPKQYQVIFTKSATAGLKMVGETFPWSDGSTFRYLRENHNSVLGIREYVLLHGATFQSMDESQVSSWINGEGQDNSTKVDHKRKKRFNLFAFPAEDNFAGVKYPLEWIRGIERMSRSDSSWYTLLDAAAYVPSQPLNLTEIQPDYVVCSFYKMFGFPTGLGALIAKIPATEILNKVFWAGGSVALATSKDNFHTLKCKPTDRLEDGTVAFLDIIALKHGFAVIKDLGGIEKIQAHVESLRKWLYEKLISLCHSSGEPMMKIFGKHDQEHPEKVQGGILNFELLKPDGSPYSYKCFEMAAAQSGFHVRTGIGCNPGAAYNYIGIQEREIEELAGVKESCGDDMEFLTVKRPEKDMSHSSPQAHQVSYAMSGCNGWFGKPPDEPGMKSIKVPLGSVRVSLGYMSTFEDCSAFARFVQENYKDREE